MKNTNIFKKVVTFVLVMILSLSSFVTVWADDNQVDNQEYEGKLPYERGIFYNEYNSVIIDSASVDYPSYVIVRSGLEDYKKDPAGGTDRMAINTISAIAIGDLYDFVVPPIAQYENGDMTVGEVMYFKDGVIGQVKEDLAQVNFGKVEIYFVAQAIDNGKGLKKNSGSFMAGFGSKIGGGYAYAVRTHIEDYYKKSNVFNDPNLLSIKSVFYSTDPAKPVLIESERGPVMLNETTEFKVPLKLNWYNLRNEKPLFNDVPDDHWARWSSDKCKELGLLSGVGNNNFALNDTLTNAQVAQILYNLEYKRSGKVADTHQQKINDVDDANWYAKAAHWAVDNGIIDLDKNGNFNPLNAASRELTCIAFYRMVEKFQIDLPYWRCVKDFADIDPKNTELREAVKMLYKAEIISGYPDGLFHGSNSLTRAQIAVILDNYIYAKGQVDCGRYLSQRGAPDLYEYWSEYLEHNK